MVFRTVGAIATALIGVRVKLWRNTIRLIRPIRASRFPLRLTLTSCRRSTRLRCRTTHCRRSEWDTHISRCPARRMSRASPLLQRMPYRYRPLAAPATNHETVGRLQRTLTACVAPFRPARPVRPDRMQYGRRPYGRS